MNRDAESPLVHSDLLSIPLCCLEAAEVVEACTLLDVRLLLALMPQMLTFAETARTPQPAKPYCSARAQEVSTLPFAELYRRPRLSFSSSTHTTSESPFPLILRLPCA